MERGKACRRQAIQCVQVKYIFPTKLSVLYSTYKITNYQREGNICTDTVREQY